MSRKQFGGIWTSTTPVLHHPSSVQTAAINLDHTQRSAQPVTGRWKVKGPLDPVEEQFDRMLRNVWIIRLELNFPFRLRQAIYDDSVIDDDARKAEQMHERHAAFTQRPHQLLSDLFLMPLRGREYHPPVASQEIGSPHSATFRLEQRFVRLAERAQAVEARNHQPVRIRASAAGIAADDLADESSINRCCHSGQSRLEARVLKELPRRPHQHEATMVIR